MTLGPRARIAPAAIFACFCASAARAGNDEGIPLGDEAALTGGSVAAMVSDGSSLFYNPAGLARAERNQIDVAATATMLRFYRVPRMLTTADGATESGSFTEFLSVPSAVSYVRGIGKDVKLGLGLFVPESFSWTIDTNLERGGEVFHMSTTIRESLYYGMIGVGWQVDRTLQLGASVAGLYLTGLATAAVWAGYDDPNNPIRLLGLSQLATQSAIGATMAVGAQWEPRPGFRVGASRRAPTFTLMTTVRGTFVTGVASPDGGQVAVESQRFQETTQSPHQARSFRLRLGVAKTAGASWASVEADFQPGVRDADINADRKPIANLRAGGMFALSKSTWLGAGAFTDRSGEGEVDSILDSQLTFYGVTTGVRLDHPHRLQPGEPASSVVFSTTIGARYAYGTGEMGGVVFQPDARGAENVGVDATVHELALYLGSTLYF